MLYSDKFTLSVVNLKHIELATEEDKAYRIDYWAALFKAKTWEDAERRERTLERDKRLLQEALEEKNRENEKLRMLLAEHGIEVN